MRENEKICLLNVVEYAFQTRGSGVLNHVKEQCNPLKNYFCIIGRRGKP